MEKNAMTQCPKCGAVESLIITSYQVGNANTPLTLVFDAKTGEAFDFEFDRLDGEISEVDCVCTECDAELSVDEALEAHQKKGG